MTYKFKGHFMRIENLTNVEAWKILERLDFNQKRYWRKTYVEKKLWGSKNSENGLFKKSHLIKKETYFLFQFSFKTLSF